MGIPVVQDLAQVGKCASLYGQSVLPLQAVRASNHLFHGPETVCCHDLTKLSCDEIHIVHHMLRFPLEPASEAFILCRDACRAGIL